MLDPQRARWRVIPAVMVRPSGFAFSRLGPLRFGRSVAAARQLGVAERARRAAGDALDEALSEERTRAPLALEDRHTRKLLARQLRRARAFARGEHAELPESSLAEAVRIVPEAAPLAAALATAQARLTAASAAYAAVFTRELDDRRAALRATYAGDERLREAVFLESPDAFVGVQQLVTSEGARDTRARQRERLAAMYLQRFCAKNDTHSICGPHAIAWLAPYATQPRITIEPGGERRRSYFSHWAAERLFEQACRRAGEAVTVALRVNPTARVDGDTVSWCAIEHDATTAFRRRYARAHLPEAALELLARLTRGPCTQAELLGAGGGQDLAALLDEMAQAGLVLRRAALAPGRFDPLDTLLAALDTWPDCEARRWGQDHARALERLLAAFGAARLPERQAAYRQLAERFRDATGDPAERGHGRHYADRSLVHEDCHASVRAEVGAETIDPLLTALVPLVHAASLPLELAREAVRQWFREQFGERRRVPVLEAHRAFDEQRAADYCATTPTAEALRAGIERVRACFAAAVAAAGDGPARVSSATLAAALDGTPCSRPGYVSLDLLFRGPATDGARPELVLGEVHGFFCLPTWGLDVALAADRERVVTVLREAMRSLAAGTPTVECVFAHTQATDRRVPIGDADLWLIDLGDRLGDRFGARDGVRLGQLELVLEGDELRFLDGEREVVPVTAYTTYPFLLYTSRLAPLIDDFAGRFFPESLLPDRVRTGDAPRMLIDDVTFRRRTWRRSAGELGATLGAARDALLLLRAQELRDHLACPEVVFVAFPGEPKPVLVDFENLFLVEAFAHLLARQAPDAVVRITEMSPGPDELLARAPDGTRTSELRMGFYRLGA